MIKVIMLDSLSQNKYPGEPFKPKDALTLRQLLEHCSYPDSPYWEFAWVKFINRFRKFIEDKVNYRCSCWNVPRLQRQYSEIVNDIVAEILHNLCKNDCRALRNFRARDNERTFLSWLGTICYHTCDTIISKEFNRSTMENDIQDVFECIGVDGVELDTSWELYQDVVQVLRSAAGKNMKKRERDIRIFTLYFWDGFSLDMFRKHPSFKNLGPRVIDNVVYRLRNALRNHRTAIAS
jgi:hypothetical protein